MKNLQELKIEKEAKFSQLISDCKMFFAFSNEQFAENKTPLNEGEKYVSTGYGGYLPKGQVDKWINGSKEINAWFKSTVKENKLRRANIAYELNNHEAYYTGDIESTVEALGEDYTTEEVKKVYAEELQNQD